MGGGGSAAPGRVLPIAEAARRRAKILLPLELKDACDLCASLDSCPRQAFLSAP